ncbi:energy-coupling factor transporter transmembrane component T family protein [Acidimangrovimonas pyrenivorans]|uniref:Energy-coupling factor transporter transmembrane component T family protein n=1 Tax=Acidimangrovimonas pyrenivorans TaxID=2030798 RepID=A0ABV7AFA2_9RHOB
MLGEAYVPGASPLHRAPPLYKILGLIAVCTALFLVEGWGMIAAGAAVVGAGFGLAGLHPRHAGRALRPLWWIFAVIFAVQLLLADLSLAGYVTARFALLILAATLVTLTTRSSDFVDGILAALRYAPRWVPRRKIALAISLCLRFIPLVAEVLEEVRQAQAARGLERNILALMVPLLVRTLKSADETAQAIYARSGGEAD